MTENEKDSQTARGRLGKGPAMSYSSPFAPVPPQPESEPAETAPAASPTTAAASRGGADSRRPWAGRHWVVLAGAAIALALGASAGGAVIAHEFWARSGSPSAASVGGGAGGSSSLGGSSLGGSGGSGSSGGSGIFGGSTPNGSAPTSIGGITIGPGGISIGSSGAAGVGSAGPSDASAIAAKVDPGLVDIDAVYAYQHNAGAGTGIVVSADGEVLTNNHVIDGATRITATDIGNGKTYAASVVGYDPSRDIAVLQLQGASGLSTATLGDSSKLAVGEAVLGIGNAGGVGGTPSTAGGEVTALNQSITATDAFGNDAERLSGLIETNADIQPGDSGGPLVDSQGQVVGMDTAGTSSFGFGLQTSSGQAFAIPIDQAASTALEIVAGHGSSTVHVGPSAFLGVQVSTSGSQGFGLGSFGGSTGAGASSGSGVAIAGVVSGEPAQKAGLAAGDVITSIDGQSVGSTSQLGSLLLAHHPGDTIRLGWTTAAGQPQTSSIRLASGPPA